MSGNGKGGDNRSGRRRPAKRRERENAPNSRQDSFKGGPLSSVRAAVGGSRQTDKKSADFPGGEKIEKRRGGLFERPRWTPPKPSAVDLPAADCAWCGKPIKEMSSAISEADSGKPVHFDCVIARISEREHLEPGDSVSYIGGGRFGIIHPYTLPDAKGFSIKKIIELENKENRSEWRQAMSDHFSVT